MLILLTLFSAIAVFITPKPEEVTLPAADVCQKDNNGKIVTFDGYLELNSFITYCGSTCSFGINERIVSDDNVANVYIKVGSGKNTMDTLPNNYTKVTTVIRDSNGDKIDLDNKLTVAGKLAVSGEGDSTSCRVDVQQIDVAEDQTVLAPEVEEVATFDNFDTEAFYEKMIAIEGYVTIPKDSISVFCYGICTLDFSATPDFAVTKDINVTYGEEENQMSLRTSLLSYDPDLKDFNGADVSSIDKLKLIGTLSKTEKEGEPTTNKFKAMWVEKI